jgi:hypothetical protein
MRPYLKNPYHKNRAGGMAQGVGPKFKPQYHKKGGGLPGLYSKTLSQKKRWAI